ncbi:hypothetical protein CEW46_30600 [Bacillus cereus]|nr:hypothetical protein CEW46_30600 [Bacillus cereus]
MSGLLTVDKGSYNLVKLEIGNYTLTSADCEYARLVVSSIIHYPETLADWYIEISSSKSALLNMYECFGKGEKFIAYDEFGLMYVGQVGSSKLNTTNSTHKSYLYLKGLGVPKFRLLEKVPSECKRYTVHALGINAGGDIEYARNYSELTQGCSGEKGNCGCTHAEASLLDNLQDTKVVVVSHSPCESCARRIIEAGTVTSVYYLSEYRIKTGIELLNEAGIKTQLLV